MKWRTNEQGWGLVSISIHWLTVLVVFGMFSFGLWMVELTYYDQWYKQAPYVHKSTGVLLFLLTIFRLVWRSTLGTPGEIPSHTDFEKASAKITHIIIYLLLFSIMTSGYLISTADGRAVKVFDWFEVPATIHGIDKQEDIAGLVHLILAVSLICLVLLHAAAAIKHHVRDKDITLRRMLGKR